MKRIAASLVLATMLSACSLTSTYVQQGEVGLLINNFTGQIEQVVDPGFRMAVPVGQHLAIFPVRVQQYVMVKGKEGQHEDEDDSVQVNSAEGQKFEVDASVEFRIKDKTAVADMYKKYGLPWDQIVEKYYRSKFQTPIINAFASIPLADSITGTGRQKAAEAALKQLQVEFDKDGIEIRNVLIRAVETPKGIAESIEAKTKAEADLVRSRTEAEKQIVQAQAAAKAMLVKAEAEAEANRKVASSLTDNLVRLRYVDKLAGNIQMVVPSNSFFNFGGIVPGPKGQ